LYPKTNGRREVQRHDKEARFI